MGDSTTGYPAPPGYDVEVTADPATIGEPRQLVDFGSQPGGTAPAAVTGGILDVRPPKRDLRMNRRVLVTQGASANDDLAFNARAVIVDNDTGQWLFEAASRRYVPPGCFGAVLQFPSGSQILAVQWQAPPGVTQPAGIVGSQALLIYTEELLDPSPGVIVAGTASGGGTGGATAVTVVGADAAQDADANPPDGTDVIGFLMGFNGATWDRLRTISAVAAGLGVLQVAGVPRSTPATGTSVANTAQTLTIPGVAGQRIRVTAAYAIANGAGGAGGLISDGAGLSFACNATGSGTFESFGEGGIAAAVGASVTFVIGAAGAGITTTASLAYFIA